MEKEKLVKIVIAIVAGILALVYYFSNKTETEVYENILTNEIVVENEVEETTEEEISKIKVYVTGEVNSPGVIELEEGSRIEDAIEGAGGIKSEANLKDINLAYEVSDGEKIYIPNLAELESEETGNQEALTGGGDTSSNSKVNINKASAAELTKIPGVGESTAQKIISYREENGKFKNIEDIKNVSGIGDSKFEKIKDYISVK